MSNNDPDYVVSDSRVINPDEIRSLRNSVRWDPDNQEIWAEALVEARAVRSVSIDGSLVGIGFLIGTRRHVVIADVCVNPEMQRSGIGHSIISSLVEAA